MLTWITTPVKRPIHRPSKHDKKLSTVKDDLENISQLLLKPGTDTDGSYTPAQTKVDKNYRPLHEHGASLNICIGCFFSVCMMGGSLLSFC